MERVAALDSLDLDAKRRLAGYARLCAKGLPDEGHDLLQSAYLRWLESDKPIGSAADTEDYLFDAISSIRSNAFRRQRTEKRAIGTRVNFTGEGSDEVAPAELVASQDSSAEDQKVAQQIYDAVAGDDDDIALYVMELAGNTSRADIMRDLGWDLRKYQAVQKRTNRKIAKLMQEGKI